jgi:tetratricopeptide (TPR) repeat protein
MPPASNSPLPPQADLQSLLKGNFAQGTVLKIDLYERFSAIKEKAREWLKPLGKNGYEHSERLESYLNDLAKAMIVKNLLSPAEAFVLLCATYMHDVGYWCDGKCNAKGHPERSREYILGDPPRYLLHDFPPFEGHHPLVAEAVGWVVCGHSEERHLALKEIPNVFPDKALSNDPLNLRKLTALLRIADEADDPYIRMKGPSVPSIRSQTPLVTIGTETIAWYWKTAGAQGPDEFVAHLKEKTEILVSSVEYLRDIGGGNWYLVLHPQVAGTVPYMVEKPVPIFVGRVSDLEELHTILKGQRSDAITGVTGTGGIGKTELAKMYAQKHRDGYPGGIFWASLKGSDWKEAAERILAVVRPGADPAVFLDEAKARDEVTKVLDRKEALLIIDDVSKAEEIITPKCSVLVTTRIRDVFGILPKQSIYPLERFKSSEGVSLLKNVLGATRVNEDPEGATRLVDTLGGMPLALEIAAKHLSDTPDITFPQYIGWVQGKVERLKIKDNPDKDVIASLALSLDLLEKEESGDKLLALFEALSVCAESGFTSIALGSAAGLSAIDQMALQQLVGKLHNRSLLEYSNESKCYSVHPLVRQVSEQRLKANRVREEEYRKNHCTYFLHYAEAHAGSPLDLIHEKDGLWLAMVQTIQVGWEEEKLPLFLDRLSTPFWGHVGNDEYELGFRYLVSSNLINMDAIGRSRDLIYLLESLFDKKTRLDEHSLEIILLSLASAYMQLGEYPKSIDLSEKALEIARRIGDIHGEGNALDNMGSAYMYLGEYRKAIDLHQEAVEKHRRIGDVRGQGRDLGNIGLAYVNLGEYRKAIDLYEKTLDLHRRIGDVRDEGNDLGNIGLAYANLGEYRKAIELSEKALEIDRRIGDVHGEGNDLGNMAFAYTALGEYRKAIELSEKALEIARRIGDVQNEGNALDKMGCAYMYLGEYGEAVNLFQKALETARRIDDVRGEGTQLDNMGATYMLLGDYGEAINLFEKALEKHGQIGDVRGQGNALGNMGSAYMYLGEYRKAIDIHQEAVEKHRRIGDAYGEGSDLSNMGTAYAKLAENEKARECFFAAAVLFGRLHLDHLVTKVQKTADSVGIKI